MPTRDVSLAPPRQVYVAGVNVGALQIKQDTDDPEAVVGVFNPEKGVAEPHFVRPGTEFTVARRQFHVTRIQPLPDQRVDVTVTWPDELG